MQDTTEITAHDKKLTPRHSKPILILTLRRTGGTSLARVLYAVNDCAVVEDEAFNIDRTYGAVTRAFKETGDVQALRASVREVLSARMNLKHAIDTVPYELTRILVEEAVSAGYCLVLLLRRSERDRLRSLAVAQATGAWGPSAADKVRLHMDDPEAALPAVDLAVARRVALTARGAFGGLMQSLNATSATYVGVFYEDLYRERNEEHLRGIVSQVGFLPEDLPAIERALFSNNGQNSGTIANRLVNAKELEELYDTLCV